MAITEADVKEIVRKEAGGSSCFVIVLYLSMVIGVPIGLINRELKQEAGIVIGKSSDIGIIQDGWSLAVKKEDGELVVVSCQKKWEHISIGDRVKIKRQMCLFINVSPWFIDDGASVQNEPTLTPNSK